MSAETDIAPSLDRSGEPWVGRFPGLGTVRVAVDGGYDVEVDPRLVDDTAAHDALEFGWAEPLSFIRRGFQLAVATTLVPGGQDAGAGAVPRPALMVSGRVETVASLTLALADREWLVVADGFTPVRATSAVTASPRRAPVITPRRVPLPAGRVEGTQLRPGGTAVSAEAGTWPMTAPVVARVAVLDRALWTGPDLVEVRGRDRIGPEVAVLGPLSIDAPSASAEALAAELAVASIPLIRLRWPDSPDADELRAHSLAELLDWWQGVQRP